jgi:hypothetical protein
VRYTFIEWEGNRTFEKAMTVDEYSRLMATAHGDDEVVDIEVTHEDGTIERVACVRNLIADMAMVGTQAPGKWPQVSMAMANPNMTEKELRAEQQFLDRSGVPTEYTKHNEPILTSREHRKRYMKAMGMHDRDAGYGDRAPNS